MQIFFVEDPYYNFFERQMQEPPGYRKRGQGIHILNQMEWKSRGGYEEIVDAVISRMQMECLKNRLGHIFADGEQGIIFRDEKHRKDFHYLMGEERQNTQRHKPNYAGAVYLLSTEEYLWKRISGNILDTGIYFDRMKIGRVTLEEYILFHAAKDVYNGTKHIRLSELADRDLIADDIFRLIINAFVISNCGIEIIEWEE